MYYSTNYGISWLSVNVGTRANVNGGLAMSASGQYAITSSDNGTVYQSVVPNYLLGNVGIGTTAPAYALDVVGVSRISSTLILGHCAFLARGPTSGWATTTTGNQPINYSLTIYNIGSCWASNVFTAPVQGIYQFSGTFNSSSGVAAAYMNITGNTTTVWNGTVYFATIATGAYSPFSVQIQMSAGATASFLASGGAVYADANDCISGCLLFRTA